MDTFLNLGQLCHDFKKIGSSCMPSSCKKNIYGTSRKIIENLCFKKNNRSINSPLEFLN